MSLVGEFKEVAALVKKIGDADLYRKIVDLQGEVVDLAQKNMDLSQEVAKLKEQLALKGAMHFRNQFYWQEGDSEPFCPRCFEADHRAIHLLRPRAGSIPWKCPNCKYELRRDDAAGLWPPTKFTI
jgi:hypothetical protein